MRMKELRYRYEGGICHQESSSARKFIRVPLGTFRRAAKLAKQPALNNGLGGVSAFEAAEQSPPAASFLREQLSPET